jgi:hypothetical protein
MKVTSPVGEFPYTFERVRVQGTRIVAEGRMGTWPARIEAGPDDIPKQLWIAAAVVTGVALSLRVGRRRSRLRSKT